MSLIKLAIYNNTVNGAAIKLVKAGRKDAIMKTQITTMKEVIEGRTN